MYTLGSLRYKSRTGGLIKFSHERRPQRCLKCLSNIKVSISIIQLEIVEPASFTWEELNLCVQYLHKKIESPESIELTNFTQLRNSKASR